MTSNLREYLDIEIPELKGRKGIRWFVYFIKAMRYNPSSNAVFLLRYCDVYKTAVGFRKLLRMHYKRLLVNRYGIYYNLEGNSHIGKGLFLPHPTSIVFGAGVNIGENCVVYQNVTFGAKKRGSEQNRGGYPQIGNNCVFYAGSVIIGPIIVEDGTQIGANSVLISNTESKSVYAGIPAMRKK